MSGASIALSPHLPCSLEEALLYLTTEGIRVEGQENRVRQALNSAIGEFEGRTGRGLMARTHREQVTATVTVAEGSTAGTGTGFDDDLELYDEAFHTSLQPGTTVLARSDAALTLSRPATAAIVAGTVTFGSRALRVSGQGDRYLYLPHHPVIELFSVALVAADGTEEELDTTAWVELGDTGVVHLPNEVLPAGTRNLKVECSAGYRAPYGTEAGDRAQVDRLKRGVLRLAQVLLADELNAAGRAVSKNLLREGLSLGSFEMPADIQAAIDSFTDVV